MGLKPATTIPVDRVRLANAQAHGPIFCLKDLREKVGVEVRFFLELSQHRQPIFCRKQLREKVCPTFSRINSQCTPTDFLSELLCVTIAGEVPLLDDVTPIFYRTEVSAHGPIFCRKQLREITGAILYRSKSQCTRTDFHSNFLSTIFKVVYSVTSFHTVGRGFAYRPCHTKDYHKMVQTASLHGTHYVRVGGWHCSLTV